MDKRGPSEDPVDLAAWREARRRRRQRPPLRLAWGRILALLFCFSFWMLAGIGCWRALR